MTLRGEAHSQKGVHHQLYLRMELLYKKVKILKSHENNLK